MNFQAILFSPLAARLGWMLLHSIWQLALVAAAVGVLIRIGRFSAGVRYAVACLGMAAMVVAPTVTFLSVEIPEGGIAAPEADPAIIADTAVIETEAGQPAPASRTPETGAQPGRVEAVVMTPPAENLPTEPNLTLRTRLATLAPWFVPPWLAGMLLLALWQLGGYYCSRRWLASAEPVESGLLYDKMCALAKQMGIRRAVRLMESARVATPLVLGWLRPAILLPVELITNLPAEHWDAVLAHELAHIRRYDYLVNLLQTAAETVLFYHPGVWMVSRWIRIERELCCDDIAAGVCGSSLQYAEALTRLEAHRREFAPAQVRSAVAAVDGGSTVHRVRRLLGVPPKPKRGAARLAGVFAAAVVLAAVAALAGVGGADEKPAEGTEEEIVEESRDPGGVVYFEGTVLDEGKPVPEAKVKTFHWERGWSEAVHADDAGRFRIPAGKGTEEALTWFVSAESADGNQWVVESLAKRAEEVTQRTNMGVYLMDLPLDSFELALRPVRETSVNVVRPDGTPIPGAPVRVVFGGSALVRARSGADGRAHLRIPAGEPVDWIAAAKDGEGLDYFQGRDEIPLPEEVKLTLQGAVTVRVKVVDTARRPVAGLVLGAMGPFLQGGWKSVDLSCTDLLRATTDENGIAVFRHLWPVPRDISPAYILHPLDKRFAYRQIRIEVKDAAEIPEIVEAVIPRKVPVRGKVVLHDGTPAAGARIFGSLGVACGYGPISAFTDTDGTYEIMMPPDAAYTFFVRHGDRVSEMRWGVSPPEGKTAALDDLRLIRGTVIRGRLEYEGEVLGSRRTHKNARNLHLTWTMRGEPVEDKGGGDTPTYSGTVYLRGGEPFSLRVPPGEYEFSVSTSNLWKKTKITVTDQPEIVLHLEERWPRTVDLHVVTFRGPPLKPVPGARVRLGLFSKEDFLADKDFYENMGLGGDRFRDVRSNDEGELDVRCEIRSRSGDSWRKESPEDRMLVSAHATHEGEDLAGTTLITPKSQTVFVPLKPAATVRGRLVDEAGKPISGATVYCNFRQSLPMKDTFVAGCGGELKTGSDGRFEVTHLPVGLPVEVRAWLGKGEKYTSCTLVQDRPVEVAGVIELGDVTWGGKR